MHQELQNIGLSEKEARVYMASLELGRATADQLSKHAKILRPTTYVQIKSLMKKGLMSTYDEGKKTCFAPESPELLKRLLTKQRDNINTSELGLTELLPDLLRQFASAGERPVVRFFDGKEGLTTLREEVLTVKSKQIFVIFSHGQLAQIYSQQELDEYSKRRIKLGIHSKGIYTFKPYHDRTPEHSLTERRTISPEKLNLEMAVIIFDNKMALLSTKGKLFGLLVESRAVANSMHSIFSFLWQYAETPTKKES